MEIELRVGLLHADRGGYDFVMKGQRGIDQSRKARGALRMANRRFHRADHAFARPGAGLPEELAERFDLDDVSQGRARAMGFDVPDGRRRNAGLRVSAIEGPGLAVDDGRSQARARPSLDEPTPLITA